MAQSACVFAVEMLILPDSFFGLPPYVALLALRPVLYIVLFAIVSDFVHAGFEALANLF